MSLARWDPVQELKSLENQMNRLFRRSWPWAAGREEGLTTEFAPPVDVYEDENKLTYKMQVAGIDPKDMDIRVEGNNLTVSGERKFEREEKKENFLRVESDYGSFCRSFTLPGSADTDKINADIQNGVLRIEIPKRPEAKGKQIKIGGHAGALEGKKAA